MKSQNPDHYPALILNADFSVFSMYPMKKSPWQETVRGIMANRLTPVEYYDFSVRSEKLVFQLPSVVALKVYQKQDKPVAFTRLGVYLRDKFRCTYCNKRFAMRELTFDHVIPSSRGGKTHWSNIITACQKCNLQKGDKTAKERGMTMHFSPYAPTRHKLNSIAMEFPPPIHTMPKSWLPYLGIEPDMAQPTNETHAIHEVTSGLVFPDGMTSDEYWNVELEE